MKLLTYSLKGQDFIGALDEDGKNILPIEQYYSMTELIESGISFKDLEDIVRQSISPVPLSDVVKRPPIPKPKQDIICMGWNYAEHKVEVYKARGKSLDGEVSYPVYFSKRVSETSADGDYIPGHWDIIEDTLDYETELAFIISKDARNVDEKNAFDHVFGYAVFNDVSARNLQARHRQYYFGKSLEGFCPFGPWIVTENEFSRPPALRLCTRVNGEIRQDVNTGTMIYDIPYIISELSKGMVLKAGTIIATGTPSGVGYGFSPQKYLKPGDIVESEIEGIGILRNEVK